MVQSTLRIEHSMLCYIRQCYVRTIRVIMSLVALSVIISDSVAIATSDSLALISSTGGGGDGDGDGGDGGVVIVSSCIDVVL